MIHESIEDIIAKLTLKSSYWAMVISKMNKREYTEKTFIVGVEFNGDDVVFLYNMENLKYISIHIIDALLEHEVGHILHNHFIRAIEILQSKDTKDLFGIWNKATDMALNCNIDMMPRSFWCGWEFKPIFPKDRDFENGLIAEDYFNKMKPEEQESNNNDDDGNNDENERENSDNNRDKKGSGNDNNNKNQSDEDGSGGNNSGDLSENEGKTSGNDEKDGSEDSSGSNSSDESDAGKGNQEEIDENSETDLGNNDHNNNTGIAQNDHEHWKANKKVLQDPNSTYVAENIFRQVIEDATKEYTESFGSLPGDLQVKIDYFLSPPKLPYYAIIKKLVVGSRLGKQKISYSKLNRKRMYVFTKEDELDLKFMPPFPGKTNDKSFKIGVLLDTSASVPITDDGIYEALNGLESILKEDDNAEITLLQVDTQIREEKKLKTIKDIHRIEVKGRGGTRLMSGLNRLKELKVDVSLVFTDGYFEDICKYVYSLPKKIIWVMPEKGSSDYRIGKIGKIVYFPVK